MAPVPASAAMASRLLPTARTWSDLGQCGLKIGRASCQNWKIGSPISGESFTVAGGDGP